MAMTLKEKLETLVALEALLHQLHFHHASQAKPGALPVSKPYSKDLADRCGELYKKIKELG